MDADKHSKPKKVDKEKSSLHDSSDAKTNLQDEERDNNDHYDFYTCYTQMPDKKCRIRSESNRCINLRIEYVEGSAASEKYRYICIKGCFDYLSTTKLH